jgi:hypothetical protein
MSAAGVHESRKLYVAAGYLRENALQVFRQMTRQRRDEPTWKEFKREFAKRFKCEQSNESLVQKLCSLSQNGSLDAYVEQFTYLVNQGSLAEDVMVGLFARGLSSDLHAEVKYRRPRTLREAINIVMQYSDAKLSGRSSEVNQLTSICFERELLRVWQSRTPYKRVQEIQWQDVLQLWQIRAHTATVRLLAGRK